MNFLDFAAHPIRVATGDYGLHIYLEQGFLPDVPTDETLTNFHQAWDSHPECTGFFF